MAKHDPHGAGLRRTWPCGVALRCGVLAWKPNNYINRVADGLGVDLEPEMKS